METNNSFFVIIDVHPLKMVNYGKISRIKKLIKYYEKNNLTNSISNISLLTRKRIYCVLRLPHVDKDSREHFEIRIHKRILEFYYDRNSYKNLDNLLPSFETDLPAGVFYELYHKLEQRYLFHYI